MVERRVAVAVIRGPSGLLVGRRADRIPPWVSLGGKIEPGESAGQAAVREAAEEAGASVVALGEIGSRVHPRTGWRMVYIDCVATHGYVRVAAPRELTEVCWVHVAELDELMPDLFGPVRTHLGLSRAEHRHCGALGCQGDGR